MLLGTWVCRKCGVKVEGTMPPKCEKCGDERQGYYYEEAFVKNVELNYGGHPDGVLLVQGEKYLLEAKSINEHAFTRLEEPYDTHILQASSYADLAEIAKIKIVYVNKNGGNKSNFWKEFTGPVDKKLVEEQVHGKVRLLRQCLHDKTLLERTACITPTSVKAKTCPVKKLCFEGWKKPT